MNYCPRCGTPLGVGQNFCRNCGLDVREPGPPGEVQQLPPQTIRGLGRNNIVYVTQDGLFGTRIRSGFLLFVALVLPIPLLAMADFIIQAGSPAVYVIAWVATSGLLYDELRWRGLKASKPEPPGVLPPRGASWTVSWRSIRMADWNGRTLWFSSVNPKRKVSITFDKRDAPFVERNLDTWGVRYAWKASRFPRALTKFWILASLLFLVGQLILILAAVLPFFPGEEQMYNTILTNTHAQVAGASFLDAFRAIYLNNIQVAWGGMLPVLGQLSFGLASYNTGRVIQVIAIGYQEPSALVLVALYLYPHTWIEESAYPIATVAGLFAVTKWRSVAPGDFAHWPNRGSSKLALSMGGVALILLAAGLIETTELYLGLGEVVFWVPVGVGYYLLVQRNRRRKARDSGAGGGPQSTAPGPEGRESSPHPDARDRP